MNWIDGHLDLAYIHLCIRDITRPCVDPEQACISLPDLAEGGVDVAFATIFTEPDPEQADAPCGYPAADVDAAHGAGLRQLEFYEGLEAAGRVRIVRRRGDLGESGDEARPLRLVLLMEGADPIRRPDEVSQWHARGLRVVGLTWWRGTRYAGGNGQHGPLTPAGVELIRALDAAGIVHDASHLADEAFDMLLAETRGRIVASHSNCRALMGGEDQRHLRDEHIRAIVERDGIIGLNLYSTFLVPEDRATIADCIRHLEHICEIAGHRRAVALGSDADGGFAPTRMPADLDHPRKYANLAAGLRSAGWSDDEITGLARGNWLRLLGDVLPRA
jgi:membrane dipeptidase